MPYPSWHGVPVPSTGAGLALVGLMRDGKGAQMDRTYRVPDNREEFLADVAEMYYVRGMTQAEIARRVGVSRPTVSHMLGAARELGIVEIRINRPFQVDAGLEAALISQFGLRDASVVVAGTQDYPQLVRSTGMAAARLLKGLLAPGLVFSLAWGMSISATVDALDADRPVPLQVVQMAGTVGARNREYDGAMLVHRAAQKLGGEAHYLNAPFLVDDAGMAEALRNHVTNLETMRLIQQCDVALVGIGTTTLTEFSSFYLSGHVSVAEMEELRASGAVGEICGHHFDIEGKACNLAFSDRTVGIRRDDLRRIPARVGVACGAHKMTAILGALRAGYVNLLVTDSRVAEGVLRLAQAG